LVSVGLFDSAEAVSKSQTKTGREKKKALATVTYSGVTVQASKEPLRKRA
jgi:hypothetical protein